MIRYMKRLWLAASCAVAVAGLPTVAVAGTNTISILTNTIAALPSCASYTVKGTCFFLRCRLTGCVILSSIRVAHYVPDAIVSTYNEPALHPWDDIGKPVAATLNIAGTAMLGVPFADSSANTHDEHQPITNFKGADAIGNPAGMLAYLLAGNGWPDIPVRFAIPSYTELANFPSQELPKIVNAWGSVPSDMYNSLLEDARKLAKAPGQVASYVSTASNVFSGITSASGLLSGGLDAASLGVKALDLAGIDLGPLMDLANLASSLSGLSPVSAALFCPGSASAFTLHFQSELDSLFWRGVVPVEILYPDSWVPGRNEVSQGSGNTWGSVYPRTGELVQANPVKNSAVIATRVADIISKSSQPHIYTRLKEGSGFRYFSARTQRKWQRLSPSPSTGCETFGANDSLSLSSYGDFNTSDTAAYAWNLWNYYDCCQRRGTFLFTVP